MLTMIETVIGETGQTLRRLAHEWGFATVFVVTLALGIGANGAIFTALNAYLLRPLPYPHAERLANVYFDSHVLKFPQGVISAIVAEYLGKTPGIASWGLYAGGTEGNTATVISNGEPKSVGAVSVTASLFKTLGVHPLLGRWVDPASNRPGGQSEVVISYRFWQSAFGGARDVIGKPLKINGTQYVVVGVMPQSFAFPSRSVELWRSLVLTPANLSLAQLTEYNWNMIARRAPGVSNSELGAALTTQLQRIVAQVPNGKVEAKEYQPYAGVIPLRQWFGGATGGELLLMQLGALLLLILAAANLGNLALVRILRRRHELGLRVALGASRLALFRLTLIETLPLGIAAAIVGWILSRGGAAALAHFGVASGQTAFAIGAGGSVGLFSVLLSLIIAFIALGAPLLLVRSRHLTALLQTGSRAAAGDKGSQRSRKGLSVLQIALAIMLLSAAALVGLSLHRALVRELGFSSEHLTVAAVQLTGPAYESAEQTVSAWRAVQSAVAALPGVTATGVGYGTPFTGGSVSAFGVVNNESSQTTPRRPAAVMVSNPGLLNTLKVHLLSGRLLDAADVQNDAPVVVVDEHFAETLFGTAHVVGRQIVGGDGIPRRIVGVIADIRDHIGGPNSGSSWGRVVVPVSKKWNVWAGSVAQIIVRSNLPTSAVVSELKPAIAKILPGQAILWTASMRDLVADQLQGTSALATLLIAFGLLAFVLASVGTYGVVAYLTRVRQREFAIRVALGARPWQIEWLVVGQGVALWAAGTVVGVGCAVLFGRFLSGELFGVNPLSPLAYIAPALVLGLIVTLASWLPARRVRRTALAETLNAQ